MKNCYMILTEKQQKYQHFLLGKMINKNILLLKKYYLLIKEVIEQQIYLFSFRKNFRKTNKNDWRSRKKTNQSN